MIERAGPGARLRGKRRRRVSRGRGAQPLGQRVDRSGGRRSRAGPGRPRARAPSAEAAGSPARSTTTDSRRTEDRTWCAPRDAADPEKNGVSTTGPVPSLNSRSPMGPLPSLKSMSSSGPVPSRACRRPPPRGARRARARAAEEWPPAARGARAPQAQASRGWWPARARARARLPCGADHHRLRVGQRLFLGRLRRNAGARGLEVEIAEEILRQRRVAGRGRGPGHHVQPGAVHGGDHRHRRGHGRERRHREVRHGLEVERTEEIVGAGERRDRRRDVRQHRLAHGRREDARERRVQGVDLVSAGHVHVHLAPLLLEHRQHLDVGEVGHGDRQLGAFRLERHHPELPLEIERHQVEHRLRQLRELDEGQLGIVRRARGRAADELSLPVATSRSPRRLGSPAA